MKKRLLVLALLYGTSISAISSEDLAEHGKKWAKQMTQKLNKEELTLLANYLYFNFLATRYEYLIRTNLILCQNQLTALQYLVNSNEENAQKNANSLIQQMAFLNNEAVPVRSYAHKAAQACFEHIEDAELPALKKVITNFQQYSTEAVNQFIQKDWPKAITKLFSTCADQMKQHADKLASCQTDLATKGALELDEDADDAELYGDAFQQAIATADLSYATYLTLLSHTLNVKSMSADILNINAIIYNIFYNHLLEALKSNKKMNSLSIMFDENGLIDEEDQDELLIPLDDKFSIHKKHIKSAQE